MRFSLRLLESNKSIEKKILAAIARKMNTAAIESTRPIENKVRTLLRNAIMATDVYQDLKNQTKLRADLGLANSVKKFESIINVWTNSVAVVAFPFYPRVNVIQGKIKLAMVQSDFRDVLALDAASYLSITKRNTFTIPWLYWLLYEGSKFIKDIDGYTVIYDLDADEQARSRTGQALMRATPGGAFRIDAQYAGTLEDNFVTRAIEIDSFGAKISAIMFDEFTKRLK